VIHVVPVRPANHYIIAAARENILVDRRQKEGRSNSYESKQAAHRQIAATKAIGIGESTPHGFSSDRRSNATCKRRLL
jgi:hypothetical protein